MPNDLVKRAARVMFTNKRLFIILLVVIGILVVFIISKKNSRPICGPGSPPVLESSSESFWYDTVVSQENSKYLTLPCLLGDYGNIWENNSKELATLTDEKKVQVLTQLMQEKLKEFFENSNNCEGLTLYCGHEGVCGLGCTLHHYALCAAISFRMGIPLIHKKNLWKYPSPWESIYQHVGSSCRVNNKTIELKYHAGPGHLPLIDGAWLEFPKLCSAQGCSPARTFVLDISTSGDPIVVIPAELSNLLKGANHQDPFKWYMGQFLKYIQRLSSHMAIDVENTTRNFHLSKVHPLVGIQARRTDKVKESRKTVRSVDTYMSILKYFQSLETGRKFPRVIFAASEDHTFLEEMKSKYPPPEWKILGFESNQTLDTQDARFSNSALKSVVRDFYVLGQSDYLICGLSSNVCRLALEIMATRFPDIHQRYTSVNGRYLYEFWGGGLNGAVITV